jgi:hypothetical protein
MWWSFVLPTLMSILATLHLGGWAFVLDIKGGYPTVMLAAAAVYLFGTTVRGRDAMRTRLALGFLLAPAILCTLTGEALQTVMRMLLAIAPAAVLVDYAALSCYIDDFIGGALTREAAEQLRDALRSYLRSVGFVESASKAQFGQQLRVLGVMVDLSTGRLWLPPDKARRQSVSRSAPTSWCRVGRGDPDLGAFRFGGLKAAQRESPAEALTDDIMSLSV